MQFSSVLISLGKWCRKFLFELTLHSSGEKAERSQAVWHVIRYINHNILLLISWILMPLMWYWKESLCAPDSRSRKTLVRMYLPSSQSAVTQSRCPLKHLPVSPENCLWLYWSSAAPRQPRSPGFSWQKIARVCCQWLFTLALKPLCREILPESHLTVKSAILVLAKQADITFLLFYV